MPNPKLYVTTFSVQGRGAFPVDMLRYDECYPASEREAGKLEHHERGHRTVTLRAKHETPYYSLTEERWASYGWTVLPGSQSLSH